MTHPSIEILLVEDDIDLASSTADFLALENITCDHAYNGQSGLKLATENSYQVLVLDLMLPRMDGITLCEKLRQQGIDTPILMLTARDTLEDKIAGFRAGTDDYLVKPFAMEELTMRIRSLAVRRSGQVRKLKVGNLTLNLDSRHASRDDVTLKLTPSCWTLLETLMRASPNPVSRKDLEYSLWQDSPPDTNSLKVHMYNLRQQVDKPFDQAMIQTLSQQGFVLRESDV